MIDLFVLLLDLLYLAIALAQYLVAPRIGPNPYLGFRIGHTLASEESWSKTNRFMGRIMVIHSLLLLPLCLVPDSLGYFLVLWIVPMLLFIPFGIRYASAVLEEAGAKDARASSERITPIKAGLPWEISPALIYGLLFLYILLTYPSLPDVFATHFDASGNPNGWSTKGDFLLLYSLLSAGMMAIAYLFIYLGRRHPLFVHPGKMQFPRDAYLKTIILAMDCAGIILMFTYYAIFIHATQGISLSAGFYIIPILFAVVIPVGYLISRWRRW